MLYEVITPGVAMDKNEGYAIQYENSFVRGFLGTYDINAEASYNFV